MLDVSDSEVKQITSRRLSNLADSLLGVGSFGQVLFGQALFLDLIARLDYVALVT